MVDLQASLRVGDEARHAALLEKAIPVVEVEDVLPVSPLAETSVDPEAGLIVEAQVRLLTKGAQNTEIGVMKMTDDNIILSDSNVTRLSDI